MSRVTPRFFISGSGPTFWPTMDEVSKGGLQAPHTAGAPNYETSSSYVPKGFTVWETFCRVPSS